MPNSTLIKAGRPDVAGTAAEPIDGKIQFCGLLEVTQEIYKETDARALARGEKQTASLSTGTNSICPQLAIIARGTPSSAGA